MKGKTIILTMRITCNANRKPIETTVFIMNLSGSREEKHSMIPMQIANNPATCEKIGKLMGNNNIPKTLNNGSIKKTMIVPKNIS